MISTITWPSENWPSTTGALLSGNPRWAATAAVSAGLAFPVNTTMLF